MNRNRAILCLAILSVVILTGVAAQAQQAQPPADVNVKVEHQSSEWAISPMWVAVGAIGLVALIALLVAVSRGGSHGPATTIVKER